MLTASLIPRAGEIASPLKLLLSPKDAAAALSISERTLWSLTNQGRLKSVRIGRSVRYAVTELERFVAAS
jgi:excisionase family DNA binding protein